MGMADNSKSFWERKEIKQRNVRSSDKNTEKSIFRKHDEGKSKLGNHCRSTGKEKARTRWLVQDRKKK